MSNNSDSGSEMDANDQNKGIYDDEDEIRDNTKEGNQEEEKKEEAPKEQTIDELNQSIAEYQDKLKEIDAIIATVKDVPEQVAELETLRKEVKDAIAYTSDLIKLKESDQGKIKISMRTLTEKDKGKVCEAFFESEHQWFAGTITNVNLETQTAEIDWLGYTEKSTVPAKYIKIAKHPDASQLEEGYFCESLYEKDG